MAHSVSGFKQSKYWRNTIELLASMRFAIALLSILAIASVIGTVLKQNEPFPNYVNQFGPFWATLFRDLSLFSVYSSWWFLLILAFLVLSTSLCVWRNAPKMLKDIQSWKDQIHETGLRAIHHHTVLNSQYSREKLSAYLVQIIQKNGYQVRLKQDNGRTLLAAKRGAANKLGYIFAHLAIVIICLGGLLDGDLFVRFETWFGGKKTIPANSSGQLISEIPEIHRLSTRNPSFRGNAFVPEGATTSTVILNTSDGTLIQDLPFLIRLKKFTVDYYSTGMPKLFASDVDLIDKVTGETKSARIKVNEPFIYKGIAIYQSSFEDGGSKLHLKAYPMKGLHAETFNFDGEVGSAIKLNNKNSREHYRVEFSGFRPINVENLAAEKTSSELEKEANKSLHQSLEDRLGSATKTTKVKDLHNVGPSFQYKLRDENGQAREYSNYMQPLLLDGQYFFLTGMRDNPGENFKYLRIPADSEQSLKDWMRLRAALMRPAWREQAARKYAEQAVSKDIPDSQRETMRKQLYESAWRVLELFAGESVSDRQLNSMQQTVGGFQSIATFLEKSVPKSEQEKAADVLLKILNGSLWQLWTVARAAENLPAVLPTPPTMAFMQAATSALSDSFFYGAPIFLQLEQFEEVKASVFQLTRSPGKNIVYIGCLLLVLGVFAMFYIRERRLWVLLKNAPEQGTELLFALSTARKTLDFEKEFQVLSAQLAAAVSNKNV
jgi:cytochrome c biogenesis protein